MYPNQNQIFVGSAGGDSYPRQNGRRRRLVLIGLVVLIILGATIVAAWIQSSRAKSSVAREFAQALIIERNADKAYALTAENFRQYSSLDDLKAYVKRIDSIVAEDAKLSQKSSEKVELPGNYPETYRTIYTFPFTAVEMEIEVTTYKTDQGQRVHNYKVRAAGQDSGAEQ